MDNSSLIKEIKSKEEICVEISRGEFEFYKPFTIILEGNDIYFFLFNIHLKNFYKKVDSLSHYFMFTGYGSLIFGAVGFLANTVAIVILTRYKELSKYFFNWLLTATAVNDNVFLATSIFVAINQHFYRTSSHDYAYVSFIYPIQTISLFASIYMMVLLSYERYKAVSQKTRYEGNVAEMQSPWVRLSYHLGLIFIASFAVNISTFWELEITKKSMGISNINDSESQDYLDMAVDLSTHRYLHRPVYRYIALFHVLSKTVVPTVLLIYFNCTIYRALQKLYQKKRHMINIRNECYVNVTKTECYQKTNRNIANLIVVLSIVCVFVLCHALCPVHIISEILNNENEHQARKLGCNGVKFWMLIVTTLSNFLVVVNASVNLFIYVAVNTKFKTTMVKMIC